MKRILFLNLLINLSVIGLHSQANAKLPFDSIIINITSPSISADDRYNYVRHIDHLPVSKQIEIEKMLVEYVKEEEDKAKLITLYSILNNHYRYIKQVEVGKSYLDSALLYVDQTKNVDALGAVYYQTGNYYADTSNEELAHEYYYKAIDCYEKSETRKVFLNFLYYKLGEAYFERDDMESLEKIVAKMVVLKLEDPYKIYYNNIYTFVARYYENKERKEKPKNLAYLDSCIHYLNKSIQIYDLYKDSAPNPESAKRLTCQNYFAVAKITLQKDKKKLPLAIKNINKGKAYMQEGDSSSLVKYHDVMGDIYMAQNDVDNAIKEYKQGETLLETKMYKKSKSEQLEMYLSLAKSHRQANDYKVAYNYLELAKDIHQEISDTLRYKVVKNLELQYDIAKKDLAISQMNARESQVIVIIFGLLIIIGALLLITLFYHIKKLKKAKEALEIAKQLEKQQVEFEELSKSVEMNELRQYRDGIENERTRLGKMLHDDVTNALAVVRIMIEIENSPQTIYIEIDKLNEAVRNISHELLLPRFNEITFPQIIQSYVCIQNLRRKPTIFLKIDANCDWKRMNEELQVEMYRILQSAVANAQKHSEADNIYIEILGETTSIKITVADDGIGIDRKSLREGAGIDLMYDRAKTVGATLQIQSELGKGTKVIFSKSITTSDYSLV